MDVTDASSANEARSELLNASKDVCKEARRSSDGSVAYYAIGAYRSCVRASYTAALEQDQSGLLIQTALKTDDPYLLKE